MADETNSGDSRTDAETAESNGEPPARVEVVGHEVDGLSLLRGVVLETPPRAASVSSATGANPLLPEAAGPLAPPAGAPPHRSPAYGPPVEIITALVLSPHRKGLGQFLPPDEEVPTPTRRTAAARAQSDTTTTTAATGGPVDVPHLYSIEGGNKGRPAKASAVEQFKDEITGQIRKRLRGRRIVEIPITRRSSAIAETLSDLKLNSYFTNRGNSLVRVFGVYAGATDDPEIFIVTKGRLAAEMTDASLFTRTVRVEAWPPGPYETRDKPRKSKDKTNPGMITGSTKIEYVTEGQIVKRRTTVTEICNGKTEITVDEVAVEDPTGTDDEIRLEEPPDWLVSAVFGYGKFGEYLPMLDGLRQVPIVHADLTTHAAAGYDPISRMMYLPHRLGQVVPAALDQAMAQKVARVILDDLVSDFPMNEQQRAAWLASVLTLAMRPALPTAPMFLLDANVAGSGKTKLAQLAGIISIGRSPDVVSFRSNADEFEKTLAAALMTMPAALILDNLPEGMKVPGGTLDSILTSQDNAAVRKLGAGMQIVSTKLGVFVTGNNLQLGGDLRRRTVHIRLTSPEEQPESRVGWKHDDLIGYAYQNRVAFLTAVFSLIESFRAAGTPTTHLLLAGSFGEWDRNVRNLILWLGLPDPWNQSMIHAKDEIAGLFERFLPLLRDRVTKQGGNGYTSKQLHDAPWASETIEELSSGVGVFTVTMLGRRLARYEERNFGGLCLMRKIGHAKQVTWHAITMEEREKFIAERDAAAVTTTEPGK